MSGKYAFFVYFLLGISDNVNSNIKRGRIMPSKKNQHFVPRFYLKNFSNDKKKNFIGLFNIDSEVHIENAKLKTQASRDYFYGKDGKVEDLFGIINDFNELISVYS